MTKRPDISPLRVLLPVGLGTGLSLIGDASLYAVLPTHVAEAGVSLASVGILLSVNRFIRLLLNGPAGMAYDRWPRRPLFVAALFVGACSTGIYALAQGFWPLLAGRLLWGLAWAGIWVGGNTIIVDISLQHNRGQWVGMYQISFFLGASSGSILGGLLTDWLGYHLTMGIGAGLTLAGAMVALLFLPETAQLKQDRRSLDNEPSPPGVAGPSSGTELASALALMGMNRLTMAGMLTPTLGLFLLDSVGPSIHVAGRSMGVASLTGIGLGVTYLVSMVAAPVMGRISDRADTRWRVVAGGLLPGVAGFVLLALGVPLTILFGLPLIAIAGGSNQGLSTAIVGDLSSERQRGRRMGILFTIGDLTSAVGPPMAYALIPVMGLKGIYLLNCGLLVLMLLVAWLWTIRLKSSREIR